MSKSDISLEEPGSQGVGTGERAGGLHTRSEPSRCPPPDTMVYGEDTQLSV